MIWTAALFTKMWICGPKVVEAPMMSLGVEGCSKFPRTLMASEALGSAVILSTSLAAFSSDELDVYVMITFPGLQKSYQQDSCCTDLRSSPS